MNVIQFWAMKLHQGPVFIDGEFKRRRSSLHDEFREGLPKSVVVPETIDAVRQLILQDSHVTYHEIETTLDISGTSIHSILQKNQSNQNQKNFFDLSFAQKNQSIRVTEVLRLLVQTHASLYRS